MSALWNNRIPDIIVYQNAQAAGAIAPNSLAVAAGDSRIVTAKDEYADAFAIILGSPASLNGSTYTILVNDKDDGSGTWRTFTDSTDTAIAPSPVSKCKIIPGLAAAPCFKLTANAPPNANTTFTASKQALT